MKQPAKRVYESPSSTTVELKMEAGLLQASKPDYIPEEW